MDRPDLEQRLDALASLAAPVRLALYRCVAGREQGLGRDEAATAVGISGSWPPTTSTSSPRPGCSRSASSAAARFLFAVHDATSASN